MDKTDQASALGEAIERIQGELDGFSELSREYEKKEIDAKEYTAVSKGFGDYLQRDEHQMIRIRVPGGRMTKEMIAAVLDVSDYYHLEKFKITSGQALQLHDLTPHEARHIIGRLLDRGVVTRGSGGDNPNNITASPLSGVERGEYFDVQPYAKEADRYLLQYTGVVRLPRKFKIGFASSPTAEMHITMKDIGFLANPDHTFDVYAAGGLGIKPRVGLLAAEHVDPSKILYHIRTMLDVYIENGNYKSRSKARSRFLQETMGAEGFLEAYHRRLGEVLAERGLDIDVKECPVTKTGDGSAAEGERLYRQRQDGLYAVSYHPAGGYVSPEKIAEIFDVMEDIDEAEIRLAPTGGLYVVNCTGKEAERILAVTGGGAETDIEQSVACVGHRRCTIGPTDSQKLLADCLEAVRGEHFSAHTLPQMRISGCISSCAAQQIGQIGWRGVPRKGPDGKLKDAFFLSYGGSALPRHENLANGKIVMFGDRIPEFLIALGRKVEAEHLTFAEYLRDHEAEFVSLAEEYAV